MNDPQLKNVGNLLIDFGIDLIACKDETKITVRGSDIGHIDLLLKHKQLKKVFFVEVSTQTEDRASKINHFFTRWSDSKHIDKIRQKFTLPLTYKVVRLYFELSRKPELPVSANYFSPAQGNYVLDNYDFRYFADAFSKIGNWAKNDFFSYLDIKPKEQTLTRKKAIQYFLGDKKAYAYVDTAANLLRYCYVSRRKRDAAGRAKIDAGYQRILKIDRIRNICKKIRDPGFLAFPNAILLSCPDHPTLGATPKADKSDGPSSVSIYIPSQFCSCRVIDGQHRLLSFARLDEPDQEIHAVPVVILEDISPRDEMKTFIEINSEQKKIDRNLILALEADWDWDLNTSRKQFFEKQAVEIAKRLNTERHSPLKGLIFVPEALAQRKGKITLTTLVSGMIKNNFIGGRLHLFQKDYTDLATPYEKIKQLFVLLRNYLPAYCRDTDSFLLGNRGLSILFRAVQTLERNQRRGYIELTLEEFFQHLAAIFDKNFVTRLHNFFYGAGGTNRAVEDIFKKLKHSYKREYKNLTTDLRKV